MKSCQEVIFFPSDDNGAGEDEKEEREAQGWLSLPGEHNYYALRPTRAASSFIMMVHTGAGWRTG